MPKIVRFDGNLKAFASEQQTNERTLFGELLIADDLTSQITAEFLRGWGIVGPSDQPTLQDFNAVGYTLGQLLAYLHQMGVAEYNALQEYYVDSLATSAGQLYISLVDSNIGNVPGASPLQWKPFVTDIPDIPDASETVKGIVELATDTEAAAGVDTQRAVTPAGVKAAIQASATGSGVAGAFSNLKASASGSSAQVVVSADELVVRAVAGAYKTLSPFSATLNLAASGVNGLDTGVSAANTWYYLWAIHNPTSSTNAVLASLSPTAPTLPSGYTYRSRIGAFRTDASANKYPLSFQQVGRRVQLTLSAAGNLSTLPVMASGTAGSVVTPTWAAIAVAAFVPPTATAIRIVASAQSGTTQAVVSPNQSFTGRAGASPAPVMLTFQTGGSQDTVAADLVLESGNIYWASSGANNMVQCFGWEDSF